MQQQPVLVCIEERSCVGRHKEFFEISKDAATYLVLGEVTEETLRHVELRRTSRSEVMWKRG